VAEAVVHLIEVMEMVAALVWQEEEPQVKRRQKYGTLIQVLKAPAEPLRQVGQVDKQALHYRVVILAEVEVEVAVVTGEVAEAALRQLNLTAPVVVVAEVDIITHP
jgi:hypothetical protein